MRNLAQLLSTPDGLAFLDAHGVHTTLERFHAELRPPPTQALLTMLDVQASLLVYAGQQVYVDYHWSVLHKILALQGIARDSEVFSFFLWLDTDRTGSDVLHTTTAWPSSLGRLAPQKVSKDCEIRYVSLDRYQIERLLDRLLSQLLQSPGRWHTGPKYDVLRQVCLQDGLCTLAKFNYYLTSHLLNTALGYIPPVVPPIRSARTRAVG